MGQYMVTHLCPPILINQYIPDRTLAEQLHLQRAHCTVKTTNEPYFTHFVNAISNYTGLLSQIKHNLKGPIPALLQRYDFEYKTKIQIGQALKYQAIAKNSRKRPIYPIMGTLAESIQGVQHVIK